MKVLILAYACEPGRGSEPGAGWGLVNAVATFADCHVLVGPEHHDALRIWSTEHPDAPVEFQVVPEPGWTALAKRVKLGWFLSYLAWLRRARRTAESLLSRGDFDVAHHATYSVYWLPSPVWRFGIPSVWGPVGGAVVTPHRLWPALGLAGIFEEVADAVATRVASRLPATRRTWRNVTYRLVQNAETRRAIAAQGDQRMRVLSHSLFTDAGERTPRPPEDFVLWVALVESRKAPLLAVRALAACVSPVRLVMVGDGPQLRAVAKLARRLGVDHLLDCRGWVPRDEVLGLMDRAAAVLFTGTREEGGIALAEALLRGCSVIVLGRGGARTIAEAALDDARIEIVEPTTIRATAGALAVAMERAVFETAQRGRTPLIDQGVAVAQLRDVFASVVAEATPSRPRPSPSARGEDSGQ